MGINDWGEPDEPLNAPSHSAWAEAVAAALVSLDSAMRTHTHESEDLAVLHVDVAGDQMQGPLLLDPDAPEVDTEAVPKKYVDEIVTVSATEPVAGVDIPSRDGLLWAVTG